MNGEALSSMESARLPSKPSFYFGNAAVDQVRNTGWFVGQFVPAEQGLRHQTGVELKWGIHPDGEKRSHPWANGNATTISVLIQGALHVTFDVGGTQQVVTLRKAGDYVVFGPDAVHSWEAASDAIVLSVRFPSVEVERPRMPARG
jgi:quercetin dioxygenase-like cupin family protein